MVDQNVLAEFEDASDCHASPVHIVIERRYVASENAVVKKSRFTADLRKIFKCSPDFSYHLPNCDEFRHSCALKGFEIFPNLDASNFFYQFKLDKERARKNIGAYVMNRVSLFAFSNECQIVALYCSSHHMKMPPLHWSREAIPQRPHLLQSRRRRAHRWGLAKAFHFAHLKMMILQFVPMHYQRTNQPTDQSIDRHPLS